MLKPSRELTSTPVPKTRLPVAVATSVACTFASQLSAVYGVFASVGSAWNCIETLQT